MTEGPISESAAAMHRLGDIADKIKDLLNEEMKAKNLNLSECTVILNSIYMRSIMSLCEKGSFPGETHGQQLDAARVYLKGCYDTQVMILERDFVV